MQETMLQSQEFPKEGAIALGNELKKILKKRRISIAKFAVILATEEGYFADDSTISRLFKGQYKTGGHLIQAIVRCSVIRENYSIPEGYEGGSRTDLFLDLIAGNYKYFDTNKVSKVADAKASKKLVNDDANRHSSDRPTASTPIATIPKKSIKRSGVSVGIREGVKLLKEAMGARSLADFSVLSGVPLSELEKIMEGNKKPDATDLARIGRVLKDLDVSALLQAYYSED